MSKPISAEDFLKLIDDFGNATLKAGRSNSGACFDPAAGMHWDRMQKLRTRLQELSPTFTPEAPSLSWTTEQPTEPGWYWVRSPNLSERPVKFYKGRWGLSCSEISMRPSSEVMEYAGPIYSPTTES